MDIIENIIASLDYILDTSSKRHVVGGILLSVSAMFGGLAVTVIALRKGDENE